MILPYQTTPTSSMIPYRDENETQRPAIVTAAIIAVNFLVWIVVQGAGSDFGVVEIGLRARSHSR